MRKNIIAIFVLAGLCLGTNSIAFGHEIFQDVLKEKYTLKSFSCKTCHPDGDDKKIRSMFAELIYQELKDKNYAAKFATADAAGKEAVAEFEKVVAKDFEKAMIEVGKKQLTIDDLFKAGLINGARLDEKKLAVLAAKKAGASANASEAVGDDK